MVAIKETIEHEGEVIHVQIVTVEQYIESVTTGEKEVIKHTSVTLEIKKEDGSTEIINVPEGIYEEYLESAKKAGKDTIVGGHIIFTESITRNIK